MSRSRSHASEEWRDVVEMPTVKWFLGDGRGQLVEDRLDHRRRELLGRQAVAAADDHRPARGSPPARASRERRHHVQVERLAERARLLRAVEHRERPGRRAAAPPGSADRERPVQPHLQDADPLAARAQPVHRLVRRLGRRAHDDDHALAPRDGRRSRRAGSARPVSSAKLVHRLLHDAGAARRRRALRGLAGLEEHVGVLRRAADHRMVGRQARARCARDQLLVDHRRAVVVVERLDLGDLVRGAEAVEEVQERHARRAAWPPGRSARGPAPPAPSRAPAARSRSAGRPSRRSGRRRSRARAWPRVRAATWKQNGVSSPAILYRFGIIRSRPWEAVNVVASAPACRAPCTAPAAPPSDCISITCGTWPQRFGRPSADHSSASSPIADDGVIG